MKSKFTKIFSNKYTKYLIIFLVVVILILWSLLVFKKIQITERIIHNPLSKFNRETSINDVNFIEWWMTFRYINIVFKVPGDYLKTKLNINDKKYPNISLWKYARNSKIDNNVFLDQIKEHIREYIKLYPIR